MASSPILNRVPPQSRQRLLTTVSAATAGALRQMGANKLMSPVLEPETKAELINLGFARETTGGGVSLTDQGQVRAMMENGQ